MLQRLFCGCAALKLSTWVWDLGVKGFGVKGSSRQIIRKLAPAAALALERMCLLAGLRYEVLGGA